MGAYDNRNTGRGDVDFIWGPCDDTGPATEQGPPVAFCHGCDEDKPLSHHEGITSKDAPGMAFCCTECLLDTLDSWRAQEEHARHYGYTGGQE
jgi:hypothetical protein